MNELSNNIKQENDNFIIKELADGTFKKEMKYKKVWSTLPKDEDEMLILFKVMNEAESDLVIPMKTAVGKEITLVDFYTNPYESFNEETGENEQGVTTTLKDESGVFYATSSKAVYFSIMNINDVFGATLKEKPLILKVTSTKRDRGDQINVSIEGFKK